MSNTATPAPLLDPSPASPPAPTPPVSVRRRFLLVWLAVSAVAVLAHFAFPNRMGIYEDDHWIIGTPMCEWHSFDQLWSAEKSFLTTFMQGRPLHCGIGFLLAYTSTHLGGLPTAFAAAAVVWVINIGLCLALLWRRYGPLAATTGALVFALLPAETTQPMLHTAFCVHPSVTFLLLSGLLYSRGFSWLSVLPAALSLLTYETCFLPALVWPLLFPDSVRSLWRRCLTHGLAMGVVLVAIFVARVQLGESRAAGAVDDKPAVAKKVRELAIVGPKTALRTFVTRPVWAAKTMWASENFGRPGPGRRTVVATAAGAGLAALLGLIVAYRASRPEKAPGQPAERTALAPASPPAAPPLSFVRLIVVGVLMAVLGYVAALNRDPQVIFGRMSSVHIAAALGFGLLFGGLAAGLARFLAFARAGWLFPPAFAGYVFLLAGFHVYVQREYIRAWAAQGEFWQDVVAECPDVKPGTVILYPMVMPASGIVHNQEWADYLVFAHLFAVPPDWSTPPQAFPIGHLVWGNVPRDYKGYDWNEVERVGDKLYLNHWGGPKVLLEPGNVILLRQVPDGHFERVTGTVQMKGVDLQLKPREGPRFQFEPNRLYPAMFPRGTQPDSPQRVSR